MAAVLFARSLQPAPRKRATSLALRCISTALPLDLADASHLQLLRACLARHILQRLADGASLRHLGVIPLHAPVAPPAFAALEQELVREAAVTARTGGRGPHAVLRRHLGQEETHEGHLTPSGKRCLLAPGPRVRRFQDPSLAAFAAAVFRAAEEQRAPLVTLSPHCLFHAHLFLARAPAAGLGLLLHACEYPGWDPEAFPYHLGHCQEGSPLRASPQQLATRNLLWYGGRMAVLDVSPGHVTRGLLWEETAELCTLYEEDWGLPLADLTIEFGGVGGAAKAVGCSGGWAEPGDVGVGLGGRGVGVWGSGGAEVEGGGVPAGPRPLGLVVSLRGGDS
ncbi:hypothetical protein HYH03_014667 [Edaphochlamys debaryana]|uniref:Uncharacterized protein n=1 Tax=Edaphochlamys debaryana TaxID=47281 RepID=A0A835XR57_9CHLO|nr:hypothetical protein HYH03_014667 [Edaphochlamys debaryana]|eukprot:KAG2486741.1 hypothetical protein HYH03_014667 [Edaphochlamys debaryana]